MSLATHLTSMKGFHNVNIFAAETLQMSLTSKQTIQNMSKIIHYKSLWKHILDGEKLPKSYVVVPKLQQ